MQQEYNALMNKKTWYLVPFSTNMNVITNKWVFRVKYKAEGSVDRYNARLLVKGFQQIA